MKVLWIGDAITHSGFGIVTHNICNFLNDLVDLVVYGIGYHGLVRNNYSYHVYPAYHSGDIYGMNYIANIVNLENPDVIVIFNDDHIIRSYLEQVVDFAARKVLLFPVNYLPINAENILTFSYNRMNVSRIVTYTDFSKEKIIDISSVIPVQAVYHGVHHGIFYPIEDAKAEFDLQNYFIVGNVNSNTFRKRLDLFVKGFAEFAADKKDVKCLIHSTNTEQTYNIAKMVDYLGIADKVILSKNQLDFPQVNLLYNLMDVNVNTSLGEGFGLSLLEGAACRVPVLCPDHGNLRDIWKKGAKFIKLNKQTESIPHTNFEGGCIDLNDFVSKLNLFYEKPDFRKQKAEEAFDYSMEDRFNWDMISEKVYHILLDAYHDKIDLIA